MSRSRSSKASFTISKHLSGFLQKSSRLFINHMEEDKVRYQKPYSLFLYHDQHLDICRGNKEASSQQAWIQCPSVKVPEGPVNRHTVYVYKTLGERKKVVSPSNWPQTSQLTLEVCRRTAGRTRSICLILERVAPLIDLALN